MPSTLEVVDGVEGSDGVKLKPQHVHRALRALAGIDDQDSGFPLPHENATDFRLARRILRNSRHAPPDYGCDGQAL